MEHAYRGFRGELWRREINVRDFIQNNYTPYEGDETFLAEATKRTKKLNAQYNALRKEEMDRGGVFDIDTETVSTITGYAPGYLDKDNEIIVGLQTDAPLRGM